MNNAPEYILLIFLLLLLVTCNDDEITSRNYPRLKTLPVSEITPEGAKFNAKITFRGDFEILNYGFAWGENESPTKENSERVVYSENIQSENFSESVETTLKEGTTYFVRAFVVTDDFVVYGENVSFISLGSNAPEILYFTPTLGTWGDTIRIIGNNFSYIDKNNVVELGELPTEVIASTDSTLAVVIPPQKNENTVSLKVSIAGNSFTAAENFNYLIPSISNVHPMNTTFGDTITINGENFGLKSWNKVFVESVEAEVIEVENDEIKFIVPTELIKRSNKFELNSVGNQLTFNQNLMLNSPEIHSFFPLMVTEPNQLITIYGKNFNPNEGNNFVLVKDFHATVLNAFGDSLMIELPGNVIPYYNISVFDKGTIRITTAEQTVSSNEELEIQWHSIWTKKSNFPGPARHTAVAFTIGDNGYFGTGLTGGSYTDDLLNDFWKYDPANDQWIQIGDFPGLPRAGANAFTIDNLGYVGLGSEDYYWGNPADDTNHFKDFYSLDPNTNSWAKIADFSGVGRHSAASFSINSKGYIIAGDWGIDNPNGTLKSSNESWEYDPGLDSWAKVTDFPNASNSAVGFNLDAEAYIYDYNKLYKFQDNNWIILPAPDLGAWDNIAFGIGGLAYFGLGTPHQVSGTNILFQYNPITAESSKKSLSYGNKRWGASVFVIGDKAYIIGGATYDNGLVMLNDVWEFDPSKPEL